MLNKVTNESLKQPKNKIQRHHNRNEMESMNGSVTISILTHYLPFYRQNTAYVLKISE